MDVPRYIYHILPEKEWKAARKMGSYSPPGYQVEGFIHFSFMEQVADTAGRYYREIPDLLVLKVDTSKVKPVIRVEQAPNGGWFPHLYGILNINAVTDVLPLKSDSNGDFKFGG
ncbi:MAG: DUF952 domain-containing protein [Anaerolinea sp.]|nr:DUF952 domain-containing protein [Anaerolinea sp.]